MLSQFRRNCTPMPSLFRLASAAIKARAESLRPPLPPPPLPSALPSPLIKSVSPDQCATYCHRSPATAERPTRTICTSGKVNARCGVGKIKINRGQHVVGPKEKLYQERRNFIKKFAPKRILWNLCGPCAQSRGLSLWDAKARRCWPTLRQSN